MSKESVKVVVRVRPMNKKELDKGKTATELIDLGCTSCIKLNNQLGQVNIFRPDGGDVPKSFGFDAVYDTDSTQRSVYDETAFPLVESVI
jgi:hypothetical protein